MKKFKFQYESVLRMRLAKEDLAKREYAVALEQQAEAERKLQGYYDSIQDARVNANETLIRTGNSGFAGQVDEFIKGTLIRIEHQKHNIERLQSITQQKHSEYMEKYRDRKAMEKLKEKQERDYIKAASKKQVKALEDGVLARYATREES